MSSAVSWSAIRRVVDVCAVQIDTGATLAPFSAFLILRGIATLHVRMERTPRRQPGWRPGSSARQASPG